MLVIVSSFIFLFSGLIILLSLMVRSYTFIVGYVQLSVLLYVATEVYLIMKIDNLDCFIRYPSSFGHSLMMPYGFLSYIINCGFEQLSVPKLFFRDGTEPVGDTADVCCRNTLDSAYNKVTFNEKLAIMKENLCTKYTPFTYKYIALNEKPAKSPHIFFHYRQSQVY